VRFAPEAQAIDVDATFPAAGHAAVDLMMPIWSPGFYRVENYATRLRDVVARGAGGVSLGIEQPAPNRWRVSTNGSPSVTISYRVSATERSVTTNWVSADYAVVNGAPTFITLVEQV